MIEKSPINEKNTFKWLIPLLLVFGIMGYFAYSEDKSKENSVNGCNKIESEVDTKPKFVESNGAIIQFHTKHLYPILSRNGINGIKYDLTIGTDGNVVACNILTTVTDKVASNLKSEIYAMPTWTPALKNGKAVCYKMQTPVSYFTTN